VLRPALIGSWQCFCAIGEDYQTASHKLSAVFGKTMLLQIFQVTPSFISKITVVLMMLLFLPFRKSKTQ